MKSIYQWHTESRYHFSTLELRRCRSVPRSVSGHLDLHFAGGDEHRLYAGTGGQGRAEILRINLVETPKVSYIVQPDGGLDHMAQLDIVLSKDRLDVLQGLPGLLDDAPGHDFAGGVRGNLAGDEDESSGLDRLRDGQRLA